jgi:hypothetical protein
VRAACLRLIDVTTKPIFLGAAPSGDCDGSTVAVMVSGLTDAPCGWECAGARRALRLV